jgi:TatA/E family protein of Tat protein translocase
MGAQFRSEDRASSMPYRPPAWRQQGHDSVTFFISLQCHRSCFYCFNPNQEDYDYFTEAVRDLPAELEALRASSRPVRYLALTGGEPLLHQPEALAFFRAAREKFPAAHLRLYTTGDHLTPELAAELRAAGLDEIRFSIRMHDLAHGHKTTFERIALAKGVIPSVMVEMPILPGSLATMKTVLLELDRLGVDSINLLELCYPRNRAEAFNQRGYAVRPHPFRVLYDYWYAGGLPIAGSESECLALLAFALENGLKLGVHYCSLENKHTGQIYQQNVGQKLPATYAFSERDYFWKTVKVFEPDVHRVRRALRGQPVELRRTIDDLDCLSCIPARWLCRTPAWILTWACHSTCSKRAPTANICANSSWRSSARRRSTPSWMCSARWGRQAALRKAIMPFNIHAPELIVILVIVILVFGVGRIGRIASEAGKGIRSFRESLSSSDKPAPDDKKLAHDPRFG